MTPAFYVCESIFIIFNEWIALEDFFLLFPSFSHINFHRLYNFS